MHRVFIAILALFAAYAGFAALDLSFVSDGDIVVGKFNSNFERGLAYADKYELPCFIVYGASDCANTKSYIQALLKDDCQAWINSHAIVLIVKCAPTETLMRMQAPTAEASGDPDLWKARQWFKSVDRTISEYPFCGMHWRTGKGCREVVYVGRSSRIPRVEGYGRGGLVSELTVRLWNKYLLTMDADPLTPAQVLAGFRGRTYAIALADDSDGLTLFSTTFSANGAAKNRIVLPDGKRCSNSGEMRVDGQDAALQVSCRNSKSAFTCLLQFDGVTRELVGAGEIGALRLCGESRTWTDFAAAEVVALETAERRLDFDRDAVGRAIPNLLVEYLPGSAQVVTVGPRKWTVAGSPGKVVFDRASGTFAATTDNPSALKFTYSPTTGEFKGEFKAYAKKSEKTLRTYKAVISGLMIDGTGHGTVTISGVGSWPVTLR